MRLTILAGAALLAACTVGPVGNDQAAAQAAGEPAVNRAAADKIAVRPGPGPDTPVSSDDPPAPAQPTASPGPDCPVISSRDWMVHVDAMPGPNGNPRLFVSGKVTVPTGGYRLALRMGPVAESYPVQVSIFLDATPPAGAATQALVTHDVRGSWRSEERVGSVTVRCGRRALARLDDIETAH